MLDAEAPVLNLIVGVGPDGVLAVKQGAEALLRGTQSSPPPPQQDQAGGIARIKREKNDLELQLAQITTALGAERAAKSEEVLAKQQAEAQLEQQKEELKELRAVVVSQDRELLRLQKANQDLTHDVESARVEIDTLKENNVELESQWAGKGVLDGQRLLQENTG